MTTISAERIAARRQSAEIAAWTGSDEAERLSLMSDAEVAALIAEEDAEAAALAERDRSRDAARLARYGLSPDQIVQVTGRGAHYDSDGVEAIDLGGSWRVVALDAATGRVHLAPASGQEHYALARPEQIVR